MTKDDVKEAEMDALREPPGSIHVLTEKEAREEELREKIDKLLRQFRDHVQECYKQDAFAPEITSYRDAISRAYKQAGYVRLCDVQDLPEPTELPFYLDPTEPMVSKAGIGIQRTQLMVYERCQQDMVKIIEKDGKKYAYRKVEL